MEVKIGQVWKEMDPRFDRHIRVVDLSEDEIFVKTCDTDGKIKPGARVTRPVAERFNGKRGGYKFVAYAVWS